jgi:hypothetical protein
MLLHEGSQFTEREAQVPSVPLITNDPYFSVWSPASRLYDADTCHWTGAVKKITGTVTVDGVPFTFMGKGEGNRIISQTGSLITPASSSYRFEGAGIALELHFTSPLLLTDLNLVSRPVTYISLSLVSLDEKEHKVKTAFSFDEGFCYDGEPRQEVGGTELSLKTCKAARMGKVKQSPLNHSGDNITIDWGYLYLAVPACSGDVRYVPGEERSSLQALFEMDCGSVEQSAYMAAAYDDIVSIHYFGDTCKGYWARDGKTILDIISGAIEEYERIIALCGVFDTGMLKTAGEIGGGEYRKICALAYRQSIAAHKLIADKEGNPVFISKECFSNGCAATVDVSYPSIPLYLFYAPELVIAMMRPIFRFARTPVWKYPFAPHDAGRYPYVTGQVYGLKYPDGGKRLPNGFTHPDYYAYPGGADIYHYSRQMPVEECGNMLIMSAAAARVSGDTAFFLPHMDLLEQWAAYLIGHGTDPGEQLCTDDFAGHLAHNVNLAAKAIMGIEAFSILLDLAGRKREREWYHEKAREMAGSWMERASSGDHTTLVFGDPTGWSLKYNLIWDKFFGGNLFPAELYEREIRWYIQKQNSFGTPLDSRKDYTKSDWLLWAASFADRREDFLRLIKPLARFLEHAQDRTPFTDWYDTLTAKQCGFQNRTVQGGLFMPFLLRKGTITGRE